MASCSLGSSLTMNSRSNRETSRGSRSIWSAMDEARQFIATATDRNEGIAEKVDTALVGPAVQLLETGAADDVVLLTTDKPAGRAAEAVAPRYGYAEQIEYRYVSAEYLERVCAEEFRT